MTHITRGLLGLVLLCISCRDAFAPPLQDAGDFATMQALWATQRRGDYVFALQVHSGWVPPFDARITVRDHRFRQATTTDGIAPVPASLVWPILTLDSLYAMAVRARADTAATLDLRFDPRTGMITSLRVDWSRRVADDEMAFAVIGYSPR